MSKQKEIGYAPGLEGIVAAETQLSQVDGQRGELIISGYQLEEIVAKASYEEMAFLLWNGRLPKNEELAALKQRLVGLRPLPKATLNLLESVPAEKVPVMDALRIGAGTLNLGLKNADTMTQALAITARLPTIVAAFWRLRNGESPIPPNPDLDHAANYLYMLTGEQPSPARTRGLETYLNTVTDHGLNASTFTARIIISTQSDMVSAIVGAIGALKGPFHGGAPGPALDMVFEIGEAEQAEPYLRAKLGQGERLMGFGHRVYKVRDPRADVLSQAAAEMFQQGGDMQLYELAKRVEETAVILLAEYKPGRNLQTNVEFYTALLLHGLGLDAELFSPTFAIGRVAGWIGHCFEQMKYGRLIRPKSKYTGPTNHQWQPINERGS